MLPGKNLTYTEELQIMSEFHEAKGFIGPQMQAKIQALP
jgi:hypothetical protein